jgi:hypothetical protein
MLCQGFEGDAWALDAAIRLLGEVLSKEPSSFWAQLALADALRKRFPASPEAALALDRALQLLARSDVGDAREDLRVYITTNATAIADQNERVLSGLDRIADSCSLEDSALQAELCASAKRSEECTLARQRLHQIGIRRRRNETLGRQR